MLLSVGRSLVLPGRVSETRICASKPENPASVVVVESIHIVKHDCICVGDHRACVCICVISRTTWMFRSGPHRQKGGLLTNGRVYGSSFTQGICVPSMYNYDILLFGHTHEEKLAHYAQCASVTVEGAPGKHAPLYCVFTIVLYEFEIKQCSCWAGGVHSSESDSENHL